MALRFGISISPRLDPDNGFPLLYSPICTEPQNARRGLHALYTDSSALPYVCGTFITIIDEPLDRIREAKDDKGKA
jgi:hypothetical protein